MWGPLFLASGHSVTTAYKLRGSCESAPGGSGRLAGSRDVLGADPELLGRLLGTRPSPCQAGDTAQPVGTRPSPWGHGPACGDTAQCRTPLLRRTLASAVPRGPPPRSRRPETRNPPPSHGFSLRRVGAAVVYTLRTGAVTDVRSAPSLSKLMHNKWPLISPPKLQVALLEGN